MRTGWLLASLGVSLLVVGCGSSSGGGTGGSGGHAGTGGSHTGGSGGHTGGSGGHAGSGGGTAGAGGGSAGAAGGSAGAAGGHAGGGGANATGGAGGAAGGHAGTGGSAGAGGTAGAAGGHAGTGGNAGAGGTAGAAGGAGGQVATDAGVDGLAACGTDNDTSEGLTCTTLDATGGCVTATISHDPPPTAAGGNIQQGTYDLVSITAYPGDAGSAADVLSPVRKTVVLTNGTANVLNLAEADLSGSFLRRQTGTLSTSGTTLTFTQACPAADAGSGSGTASYTFAPGATPTLTVIENHDTHGMVVEVYQKRP
ncbi:MAG: hypothetical protein ABUR63_00435 [Verrucomicrobiota bacterium]